MYFVTSIYRGALNIGNMRYRANEEDAQSYANHLVNQGHEPRIYRLSVDEEPVRIKFKPAS
jgi:hypothetical protein